MYVYMIYVPHHHLCNVPGCNRNYTVPTKVTSPGVKTAAVDLTKVCSCAPSERGHAYMCVLSACLGCSVWRQAENTHVPLTSGHQSLHCCSQFSHWNLLLSVLLASGSSPSQRRTPTPTMTKPRRPSRWCQPASQHRAQVQSAARVTCLSLPTMAQFCR